MKLKNESNTTNQTETNAENGNQKTSTDKVKTEPEFDVKREDHSSPTGRSEAVSEKRSPDDGEAALLDGTVLALSLSTFNFNTLYKPFFIA